MDEINFLQQPLVTEDGFINPACINELDRIIKNFPKVQERCADDPEWTVKKWTCLRHVTGALACWAIRQLGCGKQDDGPAYPPDLEKVIGFVHFSLRKKFDNLGFANLSLCDISEMLYNVLYDQGISVFDKWNTEEGLGEHWLDLDALLTNVCVAIRDERREFDRFNQEFENEQENRKA